MAQSFFPDWEKDADNIAATLRTYAGQNPLDKKAAAFLRARSDESSASGGPSTSPSPAARPSNGFQLLGSVAATIDRAAATPTNGRQSVRCGYPARSCFVQKARASSAQPSATVPVPRPNPWPIPW